MFSLIQENPGDQFNFEDTLTRYAVNDPSSQLSALG
jgi:hypothetical protein